MIVCGRLFRTLKLELFTLLAWPHDARQVCDLPSRGAHFLRSMTVVSGHRPLERFEECGRQVRDLPRIKNGRAAVIADRPLRGSVKSIRQLAALSFEILLILIVAVLPGPSPAESPGCA